jgi:hypothetical protein
VDEVQAWVRGQGWRPGAPARWTAGPSCAYGFRPTSTAWPLTFSFGGLGWRMGSHRLNERRPMVSMGFKPDQAQAYGIKLLRIKSGGKGSVQTLNELLPLDSLPPGLRPNKPTINILLINKLNK